MKDIAVGSVVLAIVFAPLLVGFALGGEVGLKAGMGLVMTAILIGLFTVMAWLVGGIVRDLMDWRR